MLILMLQCSWYLTFLPSSMIQVYACTPYLVFILFAVLKKPMRTRKQCCLVAKEKGHFTFHFVLTKIINWLHHALKYHRLTHNDSKTGQAVSRSDTSPASSAAASSGYTHICQCSLENSCLLHRRQITLIICHL